MAYEREIALGVGAVVIAAAPPVRRALARGADAMLGGATTAGRTVAGAGKGAFEGARSGLTGDGAKPKATKPKAPARKKA